MAMHKLFWVSKSKPTASMDCGDYQDAVAAEKAMPCAAKELIGQCGSDEEIQSLKDGFFTVEGPLDDDGGRTDEDFEVINRDFPDGH